MSPHLVHKPGDLQVVSRNRHSVSYGEVWSRRQKNGEVAFAGHLIQQEIVSKRIPLFTVASLPHVSMLDHCRSEAKLAISPMSVRWYVDSFTLE